MSRLFSPHHTDPEQPQLMSDLRIMIKTKGQSNQAGGEPNKMNHQTNQTKQQQARADLAPMDAW